MANKKILVITPRFPYPEAGACEQDRAEGIRQLKRLGFEVRVIGKCFDWQNTEEIIAYWRKERITVDLVPYQKKKPFSFIFDGAAAEYADSQMTVIIEKVLSEFPADIAWFDYTYLWPLYHIFKKRHIPIVVRSINFEALHYLDEDGASFIHWTKSVPKFLTEFITARRADVLFAITPKEEKQYQRIFARHAVTLPLRALYKKFGTHTPKETERFHVFFAGSTYNVAHNRAALEFVIKDIAPRMYEKHGTKYTFHIFGAKFPSDLKKYCLNNVVYEGFADDLDRALLSMDIAVVPSFFGAGMQQKIFEPMSRGFPTITNRRGIAGYDFVPDHEYVAAENVDEYTCALERLQSLTLRQELSRAAKKKAEILFHQSISDSIVRNALEKI